MTEPSRGRIQWREQPGGFRHVRPAWTLTPDPIRFVRCNGDIVNLRVCAQSAAGGVCPVHDPMTVAYQIRRPWPQRSMMPAADNDVRWRIRLHHEHFENEHDSSMCAGCDEPMTSTNRWFPWWKPSSYMPHWRLAGRDFYWPPLITIWHNEPEGYDGLTVCSRHYQDKQGKWHRTKSWKWHIHHWSFQIHPIQHLRRYLLTRCEVCGGKSRKGHVVNFSNSWSNPKTHFWQGELGLRHGDCDRVLS